MALVLTARGVHSWQVTARLKRIDLQTLACDVTPVREVGAELIDARARFTQRDGLVRAGPNPDSTVAPTLNGAALVIERPLSHGDVVHAGPALYVLLESVEARDEALEQAVLDATERGDEAALVYADWLSEHGDPLGAHVVHSAHSLPSRETGLLEGLWLDVSRGVVQFGWRNGFVSSASIREGEGTEQWPVLLAEILTLRVAFTLRELVLDLPGLVRSRGDPPTEEQLAAGAERALRLISKSACAPRLERLLLGYDVQGGDRVPEFEVPQWASWRTKLPALKNEPLFRHARSASLVVEGAPEGVGVKPGDRVELTQAMTLKGKTLVGEWPLAPMRRAETYARLSNISMRRGCWMLRVAGRDPYVRLNGAHVEEAPLLPGDVIDVDDRVALRFVLDP